MNPDSPIDPRSALEASLTALLLGELPHDQAATLHQKLAQDAELAALYERLKQTINLVRETIASPAQKTAEPLLPLRLEEQRRQKLLQHLRTAAPREFAPPPRRWRLSLVEGVVVVGLIAILTALLLPALGKAKAKSQSLARRSFSLSTHAESGDAATPMAPNTIDYFARSQDGRMERYASKGEVRRGRVPLVPRAEVAPPPPKSAGSAIVLPEATKLADANTEAIVTFSPQAGSPVSATTRGFYDESVVQAGAVKGGGAYGVFAATAPSDASVAASRPAGVPASDLFFSRSAVVNNFDADKAARKQPEQLGTLAIPAPPTVAGNYAATPGVAADDALAAAAPAAVPPPAVTVAEGRVKAGDELMTAKEAPKGIPMPGSAVSGVLPSEPPSAGFDFKPSQTAGAGEIARGSIATADFGAAAASADSRKYQWHLDATAQAGVTSPDAEKAPVLGDLPVMGRFYLRAGDDSEAGGKAKVEEKVRSVKLAAGEDLARQKEGSKNEAQDLRELGKKLYSANAVGYANVPVEPKDAITLNTGKSVPPGPRAAIALPAKPGEPTLALTGITDMDQNRRQLFKVKRELDEAKKVSPATPAPVPQPEVQTSDNAYSTFSLNVSDVSFKLAGASLEKGAMPEPASVRSEEFINAFDYRDPEPPPGVPVAFAWERAQYPFAQNRDLLRFSIKTAALGRQPGRPLNLVLLLDNSGSMERADRVRIIREALRVLAGQLQAQDKFSVVTFSRTARLWVDGVPGTQAARAAEEVGGLAPQGGTNLEEAMNLAYQTALRHYLANGVNRVVLLTDGAANLGNVEPEALKAKVETHRKQGIALDCFGIGWEGYNDDLLEVLSRNGDGRYGFVNTPEEAATEFAGQLAGALRVAASDVKVQVEFNPARVTAYRQIGYAKHQLTKEQFRDNTVDAAEIGAAESGNALYVVEVNPRGDGPLATVRVRYKVPGTTDYREQAWPVPYTGNAAALEQASPALRLAAAAGAFSEWLASSPYAAEVTPDRLLKYLNSVPAVYGADARPGKLEWMLRQAKSIAGK